MYIIGILIGLYLHISIVFLIVVAMVAVLSFSFLKLKNIYVICTLIILFGVAHVYVLNNVYEKNTQNLYREAKIKAVVISNPEDKEYKYSCKIKVATSS